MEWRLMGRFLRDLRQVQPSCLHWCSDKLVPLVYSGGVAAQRALEAVRSLTFLPSGAGQEEPESTPWVNIMGADKPDRQKAASEKEKAAMAQCMQMGVLGSEGLAAVLRLKARPVSASPSSVMAVIEMLVLRAATVQCEREQEAAHLGITADPGSITGMEGVLPAAQVLDVSDTNLVAEVFELSRFHYVDPRKPSSEAPEAKRKGVSSGKRDRKGREKSSELTPPKPLKPLPLLAQTDLFWRSCMVLLLLAASNPSTIGRHLWERVPTLRCLMQMVVCTQYEFPPPGAMAVEDGGSERSTWLARQRLLEAEAELRAAERDALNIIYAVKKKRKRAPAHAPTRRVQTSLRSSQGLNATGDGGGVSSRGRKRKMRFSVEDMMEREALGGEEEDDEEEEWSGEVREIAPRPVKVRTRKPKVTKATWKYTDYMIFYPGSVPRAPPPAVLEKIKDMDARFHIGARLRRSTNPDFITATMVSGKTGNTVSRARIERSAEWLLSALAAEPEVIIQRLPMSVTAHLLLLAYLEMTKQSPEGETSGWLKGGGELLQPLVVPVTAHVARYVWGQDREAALGAMQCLLGDLSHDQTKRRSAARRALQSVLLSPPAGSTEATQSAGVPQVSTPATEYCGWLFQCQHLPLWTHIQPMLLCAVQSALTCETSLEPLRCYLLALQHLADGIPSFTHSLCKALCTRVMFASAVLDRYPEVFGLALEHMHLALSGALTGESHWALGPWASEKVAVFPHVIPGGAYRQARVPVLLLQAAMVLVRAHTLAEVPPRLQQLLNLLFPEIGSEDGGERKVGAGAAYCIEPDGSLSESTGLGCGAVSLEQWIMLSKAPSPQMSALAAQHSPPELLVRLLLGSGLAQSCVTGVLLRLQKIGEGPGGVARYGKLLSPTLPALAGVLGQRSGDLHTLLLSRLRAYQRLYGKAEIAGGAFMSWLAQASSERPAACVEGMGPLPAQQGAEEGESAATAAAFKVNLAGPRSTVGASNMLATDCGFGTEAAGSCSNVLEEEGQREREGEFKGTCDDATVRERLAAGGSLEWFKDHLAAQVSKGQSNAVEASLNELLLYEDAPIAKQMEVYVLSLVQDLCGGGCGALTNQPRGALTRTKQVLLEFLEPSMLEGNKQLWQALLRKESGAFQKEDVSPLKGAVMRSKKGNSLCMGCRVHLMGRLLIECPRSLMLAKLREAIVMDPSTVMAGIILYALNAVLEDCDCLSLSEARGVIGLVMADHGNCLKELPETRVSLVLRACCRTPDHIHGVVSTLLQALGLSAPVPSATPAQEVVSDDPMEVDAPPSEEKKATSAIRGADTATSGGTGKMLHHFGDQSLTSTRVASFLLFRLYLAHPQLLQVQSNVYPTLVSDFLQHGLTASSLDGVILRSIEALAGRAEGIPKHGEDAHKLAECASKHIGWLCHVARTYPLLFLKQVPKVLEVLRDDAFFQPTSFGNKKCRRPVLPKRRLPEALPPAIAAVPPAAPTPPGQAEVSTLTQVHIRQWGWSYTENLWSGWLKALPGCPRELLVGLSHAVKVCGCGKSGGATTGLLDPHFIAPAPAPAGQALADVPQDDGGPSGIWQWKICAASCSCHTVFAQLPRGRCHEQ
ncbi:unnamed protein product [Chrysoparadoxa australica]